MVNSSDDSINSEQDSWGVKALGEKALGADAARPVSSQEIQYLINRYPFLRVLDAQTDFNEIEVLPSPRLVKADTGWLMQDFGFYICSSPGELLYGNYAWAESKEGEEGEGASELNPGRGTLIKQAFDTAADMVALGKSHGWETLYILEGTELMEWAAWVIGEELGLKVEGYEPSRLDEEKKARLKRSRQLDEMSVRMKLY